MYNEIHSIFAGDAFLDDAHNMNLRQQCLPSRRETTWEEDDK